MGHDTEMVENESEAAAVFGGKIGGECCIFETMWTPHEKGIWEISQVSGEL